MFEFSDYRKTTCQYWHQNQHEFLMIYNETFGKPCPGCGWKASKECPGIDVLLPETRRKVSLPAFTNAEIATELGTTKRSVAKMRKEGTLPERFL